jgi:hypothetical protein
MSNEAKKERKELTYEYIGEASKVFFADHIYIETRTGGVTLSFGKTESSPEIGEHIHVFSRVGIAVPLARQLIRILQAQVEEYERKAKEE